MAIVHQHTKNKGNWGGSYFHGTNSSKTRIGHVEFRVLKFRTSELLFTENVVGLEVIKARGNKAYLFWKRWKEHVTCS